MNAIPTLTGTKQHEAVTTVGSALQTRLEAAVLVKRKFNLKTESKRGKITTPCQAGLSLRDC